MMKIKIFLVVVVISIFLVGCNGNKTEKTEINPYKVVEIKGDLKEGSKINIEEEYYTNDKSKTIFNVEGYIGMKVSQEYLLLLNKSTEVKNDMVVYQPMGVLYGQIPVEPIGDRSTNPSKTALINKNLPESIQKVQIEISKRLLIK